MKEFELEEIKNELAFALYAVRLLRLGMRQSRPDGLWIRLFQSQNAPQQFDEDLRNSSTEYIEKSIPELTVMLEIKILDYRKALAQQRLDEIKGQSNGK